ncbi:LysR family transcriptional regulator [Actinacidiphila sp. ITFR-21]|uniref:LysR family transcriptional regulator n=1 Tax=Actinacidiphila sp. ITFR-21 TaxID=3075199 RepID=UPI00288A5714|nr:LysR family transcriptional regulator [Streptomyces sp. ITFR-21]WNI14828.1 LysR family transcriptional regulator [Streptomyces sp. ITFR-21]
MAEVLDIAALRTFTSIADCGGFHRAAAAIGLSQSAVSQHVRRLEKAVGRPLVERDGRGMRFTPPGETLLSEARKILAAHDEALFRLGRGERETGTIVVGSTEHAADRILPAITGVLQERYPAHGVRFRLDRSGRLNAGLDRGSIDVAVFLGDAKDRASASAGALPLSWFSAPSWRMPAAGAPIPVVVIDNPCTIRRRALETLAEHGMPAEVVVEAAYLAGVMNAIRGGLGVGLLADVGPPPEGLERRDDLPPVPPELLHLRTRADAPPQLAEVTAAAVRGLLADRV